MLLHTIPPFFAADSRVLILGSFPSPKSRETGFYYGHPQNRFWSTVAAVLGVDVPRSVEEKKKLLRDNKIALWDVVASCDIVGAQDSTIKNVRPNDFSVVLGASDVRRVFVTGKTAFDLYKKFVPGGEAVLLPSPSPANCATSREKLVEAYRAILPYIKGENK